MIDIEIRPARPLDAGAVGHILSVSNDLMPWLPRVHTAAEEIGFSGDMIDAGWVRVARVDGKLVGFIARHETELNALAKKIGATALKKFYDDDPDVDHEG